jgi:hypothetical protein
MSGRDIQHVLLIRERKKLSVIPRKTLQHFLINRFFAFLIDFYSETIAQSYKTFRRLKSLIR